MSKFSRVVIGMGLALVFSQNGHPYPKRGYDPAVYQHAIAQSDHLIVPGRVGPIRLDMYMDEVAAILGPPQVAKECSPDALTTSSCISSAMPLIPELPETITRRRGPVIWDYDDKKFEIIFREGPAPRVYSIGVFHDSKFVTEKGLRIGMSTFDVDRIYGLDNVGVLSVCLARGAFLQILTSNSNRYEVTGIALSSNSTSCH